ncbi:hypothetical protein [Microbacterium sp.]|uniref:phage tail protein n=1 Tax=Microbacterium sp. TaxID=51671 RepID=UPI002600D1E8|nr:hypothetical protein [Microbacterium sp.]MBT9608144.1 hypothetical protein [Microbacterium sp.]
MLVHAGIDIVAGLVRGLWDAAGGVVDMLLNLAGGAVDAFKDFFGIKSPSRLLMTFGEAMGGGLVEDFEGRASDFASSADVARRRLHRHGPHRSRPRRGASLVAERVLNADCNATAGFTAEQELTRAYRLPNAV